MTKKHVTSTLWDGQLLEIVDTKNRSYFTQLVRSKPELLMQRPVNKENVPMAIDNGMSVDVYFFDDVHGLCTFNAMLDQIDAQKIRMNKADDEPIVKAQRRRFFRMNVTTEMKLYIPDEDNEGEMHVQRSFTSDISGGGLSFITWEHSLAKDNIIEGKVTLHSKGKQQQISFKAIVIRILTYEDKRHRISLQFLDLNETERTAIIRYCMEKQIEFHKRTN